MLVRCPDRALGMFEMGNMAKGRPQHGTMEKGHPEGCVSGQLVYSEVASCTHLSTRRSIQLSHCGGMLLVGARTSIEGASFAYSGVTGAL